MSLAEHVFELRRRLAVALLAIALGTIVGFWWYDHAVGVVPSLGALLTGPYCSLPVGARLDLGPGGQGCRLLAIGPFDQFLLRLKVAATAGAVVAAPIWLTQLWGFVVPGLRPVERRTARWFIGTGSLLFVLGAVLAYLVVAEALNFLLTVGSEVQVTALGGDAYFSLVLSLVVVFGASFLTPLVVVALNRVSVLSYARLAHWRRGIIVGLFAFAGIATPGGDPISMSALALTLCVLVEIAIQVCRVHDRRLARSAARAALTTPEPVRASELP
ncbi:twin-arginine translocase subunit TatC [Actinomycetospora corticicola]|uniref:Sec-independent protein translocase protein TatC n=1 Tax=Actinomycetospora corticicola TaxID=663602 RepID=A0A7Y9J8U9_9PSEU|nr:twin-arginine translocase subunit TatC [Actinomycetospora corticicola]NYD39805.1 sec-independent protein translocase protein TatC [Actinomycetospora corticicola]